MIETVAAMMEVKNLSKILQNSICHISVGMRLYSGGLCFFLVKPEIDFDLLVNWNIFSMVLILVLRMVLGFGS